jgi:CxxC motif-containing protein (DUF1111 family)
VFTEAGCIVCHATPVPGGNSSTKLTTLFGKTNPDGSFNPLTNEGGSILQAQSASQVNPKCTAVGEVIPADATIVAERTPPAVFGAGRIDAIDDSSILANAIDKGQGIHGVPNMVVDYTGTTRVGRFGHKAQLASLMQASAFALQHDIGITNPIFPSEDRPQGQLIPPGCVSAGEPNDPFGQKTVQLFEYATFLAPASPGPPNQNGKALFTSVGCALCHVPSYVTDAAVTIPIDLQGNFIGPVPALSNQTANLYSDLLLHDMGTGLADGIPEGQATGSQWKTPPLWGLARRTVYMHDARAKDLDTAIQEHGGEAAQVIANFNQLSSKDQSDLIAFINSL